MSFSPRSKMSIVLSIVAIMALLSTVVTSNTLQQMHSVYAHTAATTDYWASYAANNRRVGFNFAETTINATTARNLKQKWVHSAGTIISDQAVEANSMIYWGSWDGLEHGTNLNGTEVWTTNLGTSTASCVTTPNGIGSTSTIGTITLKGLQTSADFVGGGNGVFYALNALTGAIIWQTSLRSDPNDFLWSSPLLYDGSIYEGVAALTDCPTIPGELVQMSATTGAVQHIFDVVPKGCTGGGVWGSPTVDPTSSTIYFATGNQSKCSISEPLAPALVAVRASDLSLLGSWKVPTSQHTLDNDFGSTPTLFPISINEVQHFYVGVGNKNGLYYAFDDANISAGPVWTDQIAIGGPDPGKGDGVISPSSWNGTHLFVAGGNTTINGTQCKGSLQSVDPTTGAFLWQDCFTSGPIIGAVSGVPGVIVVGASNVMFVVNAKTGATLFSFQVNSQAHFWSGASIVNGVLYMTCTNGNLYAFAP